ncbi:Cysteine desulfurase [hydrothermal vent metagenome]|uniref:cysteine desulfurase n=1 Tax=hydrothermal vent metagenome TaxID=652676 RepID=A0A3B1C3N4_9ZZZZ
MNELRRVYLDHNATAPVYPEVLEAMLPFFQNEYGNPSSVHQFGRAVKAKISEARETVAEAMGADPSEVYFTSGGTEADNLAVKGAAFAKGPNGGRIITSTIEHPAILEVAKYLSKNGYKTTIVEVDSDAVVDPEAVREAIDDETIIVSIMHGNSEVGSIQPVKKIAEIVKERGALMHTDAVQTFCKIPLSVNDLGVDMMSVSGHKIYAAKGVGALYIRKGTKIHPLAHGGHHERSKRAGTENVAGIIGFAKAVEIGMANMDAYIKHVKSLRDDLQKRITDEIPFVKLNGHPTERTPGTLNMSFECVEGEALLINLDMVGIAISTGSACSSGSLDPSHVLMAMGIPHEIIHGSLRFSFGSGNTKEDVDYVMSHLPRIINTIREISPLWNPQKQEVISLEQAESDANLGR